MDALAHQKAALDELVARARAYFSGSWINLPIQPRWPSLIVGPTGSGKTTVAAMATKKLNEGVAHGDAGIADIAVSQLRVSVPSWMPCGAHNRGTRETIGVIAQHVATHNRTILVLDEIDKFMGGATDTWQSYLRSELYDLIDCRWPTGLKEIKDGDGNEMPILELTRRLKHGVYIVGVGTFQNWFDSAAQRRSMGFGAEVNPANEELSADIIAERMPRELANRFHSGIIRLPELGEDDYQRIADEAAKRLPERYREAFRREITRQLPGAIAAKKGVRFLGEAIVEVLKTAPEITLAETILMDGI